MFALWVGMLPFEYQNLHANQHDYKGMIDGLWKVLPIFPSCSPGLPLPPSLISLFPHTLIAHPPRHPSSPPSFTMSATVFAGLQGGGGIRLVSRHRWSCSSRHGAARAGAGAGAGAGAPSKGMQGQGKRLENEGGE
eukprot:750443-Hanusia_phi.AAC.2